MSKIEKDTLKTNLYCMYDKKLCTYSNLFSCSESELNDILIALVNSVDSKYYNHETDYLVCQLATFNTDSGVLDVCSQPVSINELAVFIDEKRRNIQHCIQTLNYLPIGYFKMPKEMQEDIQKDIDKAVKFYVDEIVNPSMTIKSDIS